MNDRTHAIQHADLLPIAQIDAGVATGLLEADAFTLQNPRHDAADKSARSRQKNAPEIVHHSPSDSASRQACS